MKLKELFEIIEKENKFNEFMGNCERKVVKMNEYGYGKTFKTMKEFLKFFKEGFYGELTKDTILYNNNGFIKFDITYNEKEWNGIEVVSTEKQVTYSIYIDEIQEWN